MSDPTPTPDATSTQTEGRHRCHGRRPRGRFVALTLLVGLGLLVAVPWAAASGIRHAMGGHGFGGHCMRGGELTQEGVRERLGLAAGMVLERVDATDDQRDRVDAILDDVAPKLFEARAEGAELHAAVAEALAGDRVDRKRLEAIRTEGLAHADEASRIVLDAVADFADVLTPEQRAELIEVAARLHGLDR